MTKPVTSVTPIDAVGLSGSVQPQDFSFWGSVANADILVQIVMLLLLSLSVWCWAVIFQKYRQIRALKSEAREFEDMFWSGGSIDRLYEQVRHSVTSPMIAVFVSGMKEWRYAVENNTLVSDAKKSSLRNRIERIMTYSIGKELEGIEQSVSFLASVGSTAPFIGLFGTVWGMMNSLQSIAASKNTSLAVVAPGIAEALIATALGLFVAIPAVLAYNKISAELNRYAFKLENFTNDFLSIITRHMEDKK